MRELALMVGGRRIAADSGRGGDIPQDLRFSTSAQGGFQTLDCQLLRDIRDQYGEAVDDDVQLVTAGGARTLFDGRLNGIQRSITRRRMEAQVAAVGLAALLEDREDLRWLGIDRDLSHWQAVTTTRRRELFAGFTPGDGSVEGGTIRLRAPSPQWSTSAGRPNVQLEYVAEPLRVARVAAEWGGVGAFSAGSSDANWVWQLRFHSARDTSVSNLGGTDFRAAVAAGAWTVVDASYPAGAPVANVVLRNDTAPGGAADANYEIALRSPCVIGDHGLTLTGSGPSNYGLKMSDAVRHWLARWAPDLRAGEIADSIVGIQHLAFLDPKTTLGQMIQRLNDYHAWAWGVWEGGRFDLHPFGEGRSRTWIVRGSDPGVTMTREGVRRSQLYTDVVVQYQDVASGQTRTVGAPGTICDVEAASLSLSDPTHPLRVGGSQRVQTIELGVPADQALATWVGEVALVLANAARRAGTITLGGAIVDEHGNPGEPHDVRGGDQVIVADHADTSARRVMTTEWAARDRQVVCAVDRTLQTLEAMLAHLGARAVGRR